MPANLENSALATEWEKVSFHSNPKERQCQRMLKLPHNCTLVSHASKVMLKILQARLQQYLNCELPDVQAGFRKGRGTRDQIANIRWIIEKTEVCSDFLFRRLFLIQGSNPYCLHCRWILYWLSHQGYLPFFLRNLTKGWHPVGVYLCSSYVQSLEGGASFRNSRPFWL